LERGTQEYEAAATALAEVRRELEATTPKLRSFKEVTSQLGGDLTRIGTILSAGVTAPLTLLGAQGIRSAQQLEVFQQSLNTLIGDAEKARDVFEELYEFDTSTPFTWASLSRATTLLAAFNTQAEEL